MRVSCKECGRDITREAKYRRCRVACDCGWSGITTRIGEGCPNCGTALYGEREDGLYCSGCKMPQANSEPVLPEGAQDDIEDYADTHKYDPIYEKLVDSMPFNGMGEFNDVLASDYDALMETYGSVEEAEMAYWNTH